MSRGGVERWLTNRWYSPAPPPLWLRPLSGLFILLSALRRRLLRPVAIGAPVLVVGNITVGGTGKTPLIMWLVERARELGFSPGVVSRGHGGAGGDPQRVTADSDPRRVGDEPVLLARRAAVPVWIGRDRVAAARRLREEADVDLVLSDDGLQHYRLARDAEIALVDARRGLGNGWRLPAGPLREPPSRLDDVDLVVGNGGPVPGWSDSIAMRLEWRALRPVSGKGGALELAWLSGRRIHAVAGIGHPERFFAQLREHGAEPHCHAFADHAGFDAAMLRFGDSLPVVMTEKDAVKCAAFAAPDWYYIEADAAITPADTARFDTLLRQLQEPSK